MFGWEFGATPVTLSSARPGGRVQGPRGMEVAEATNAKDSRMLNDRPLDGGMRREADLIELSVGRGRFRRRRQLDQSAEVERLVLEAVNRAKDGDPDALRFLYLRYADNVYGYVCSIVRDEHEAEDVTQQVFAKLLGSLGRYEPRA